MRRWLRLSEFALGPPFARRLALSHAIDDIGDAMINLSLVNSLFLSVSADASRSRIMMYLLLAAAPLAVAAPLIGNVLDRTRIGYSLAISGSQALRAVVSVALLGSLLTIAVYPLTFLVLIARKVYGLAKTALLAELAPTRQDLLLADAHMGRVGTVGGGIGTVSGGVLLVAGHVEAMLVIAPVAFALAAGLSRGIARPPSPVRIDSAPRLSEAIPRRVWSAVLATTSIRAAAGALTYLLAFAIKRGGGDEWIFAAGLIAAGAGGLIANLLAGPIHRVLDPNWIIVLALFVPGFTCLIGVVTVGNFGVLAIAFSIGLGRGVATRAITGLLATVPALVRGRAIARSELLFHIASLIGASLAVQYAPTPTPGFAVSSLALVGTGVVFASVQRQQLRHHASRLLLGDQAPAVDRTLPRALLGEAHRLASLGGYRMAVVVAAVAVDVLVERQPSIGDTDEHRRWTQLLPMIADVRTHDDQPDETVLLAVLQTANAVIGEDHRDPAPTNGRAMLS